MQSYCSVTTYTSRLLAASLVLLCSFSAIVESRASVTKSFEPSIENKAKAPTQCPKGMVWIPGGEFSMGSEDPTGDAVCGGHEHMPDSRPIHRVYVDGFWMDKTEVTNEEFAKFVKATAYRTVAEIAPTKEEFPTAPPENLIA
jgi:formylglycine-generating enzyme required for sulfatase activity